MNRKKITISTLVILLLLFVPLVSTLQARSTYPTSVEKTETTVSSTSEKSTITGEINIITKTFNSDLVTTEKSATLLNIVKNHDCDFATGVKIQGLISGINGKPNSDFCDSLLDALMTSLGNARTALRDSLEITINLLIDFIKGELTESGLFSSLIFLSICGSSFVWNFFKASVFGTLYQKYCRGSSEITLGTSESLSSGIVSLAVPLK